MITNETNGTNERFDYKAFIAKYSGATVAKYSQEDVIYAQGEPADAAFYIISGSVKVTVVSEHGKEAVLALLMPGDFFGEECIDTPHQRNATVTATSGCDIVRVDRNSIARALGEDPAFSRLFLNYVLNQNERLREDIIDQLFNSSEKRLARALLTLANAGANERSSEIAMPITQETLANMVGTTRSRINQFMRRFSKLGYVDYDGTIRVHQSLQNIFLEEPHNHTCGGT